MLSIHAKDNPQANTFQFLITKTRPFPIGGDPPSWFKGAGHADDLRVFFNFSDIFEIPDEKRKEYDKDQGLSEKNHSILDQLCKVWVRYVSNNRICYSFVDIL